jgi:1,4-alpha-glucan branching enzyme
MIARHVSLFFRGAFAPLVGGWLAACGGTNDGAHGDDATVGGDDAIVVDTALGDHDAVAIDDAFTDARDAAIDAGPSVPRLGAEVDASGVTFRVWAPKATAAWVTGDFPEAKVAMTLESPTAGIYWAQVATAHAGTTYRFVFDSPAGAITRLDPWCRARVGDGCLVVDPGAYAWKTAPFERPARTASIVYELHPGSFAVDPGALNGTFQSAQPKLAALAELGVDVVELMPVHDSASDPTHWGYNSQLFHTPHPGLGKPDDLRAFVDEAHRVGIAVWIDVVINHTTGGKTAPLYCFDGNCADGSAGLYFFPPGTYAKTPWGPRPDYTKPQVADMLTASAEQWLVEYRGDGFRWDSVSNIRAIDGAGTTPGGKELLQRINDRTHALGGIGTAEDLKGWDGITKSTASGGLGFDAQWDGFGYQVVPVLVEGNDDLRDLGAIQGALTGSYAGDPFARLIFLETHDTVGNGGARLPKRIDSVDPTSWAARRRSMLGAVLLMTSPGVPMIFMGEESLATTGFDSAATPLAAPTTVGLKMQAFYRDLARLRRNLDGGSGGLLEAGVEVFHRNDTAKVIAYRRHGASGEDVIVIVNLRNKAYTAYDIGVDGAGPWKIRLDSDRKAYGDDFAEGDPTPLVGRAGSKDGRPFVVSLKLPAYGAMVLTK